MVVDNNLYELDCQVEHIGRNLNSGHYIIGFYDDEKFTVVNDKKVDEHRRLLTNANPDCTMLLYKLIEISPYKYEGSGEPDVDPYGEFNDKPSGESDNEPSDKLDDTSSINEFIEFDDFSSGMVWKKNSCGPDTHFSLLRVIYHYYLNKIQKDEFTRDWPSISNILVEKNLLIANLLMRNLVYNSPATPFIVGVYMGICGLQRFLCDIVDPYKAFPSSIYYQFSSTTKCMNDDCTRNSFEKFVEDHDHILDLHIPAKDSPPISPSDSFQDRLEHILVTNNEKKFNLLKYNFCHFCNKKGTVGKINISHKPSLLIISFQGFISSDTYLPDNIRFGDINYLLVAVAYFVNPNHYIGKLRFTDNWFYDYDGMKNTGQFKKTSLKMFKIKPDKNTTPELLYYIRE